MKKTLLCLLALCFSLQVVADSFPSSARAKRAFDAVSPSLSAALDKQGLRFGAPVFIRIFKLSSELEIWVEDDHGRFQKFRTYPICTFSGHLGPKIQTGDHQSPEGFYHVGQQQLNPWSQFHLAFNLGYPNRYDRSLGRTGSYLMVHGNCVSIGCYAMTDEGINEIYTLLATAIKQGQTNADVHIFPFRLTQEALSKYKTNPWYAFWQNLKQGYDYFEHHKRPPNISVSNKRYLIHSSEPELP